MLTPTLSRSAVIVPGTAGLAVQFLTELSGVSPRLSTLPAAAAPEALSPPWSWGWAGSCPSLGFKQPARSLQASV